MAIRCLLFSSLVLLGFSQGLQGQATPCAPAALGHVEPASEPVDYVLAIDNTGSMNRSGGVDSQGGRCSRWEELHEKLVATIGELQPGQGTRLHLFFFGSSVYDRQRSVTWRTLGSSSSSVSGNQTTAITVDLRTESEKLAVLDLLARHKPNSGHTALWDAVAASFDRALEVHRREPNRRIVIAVFTDGEDNNSSQYTTKPAPGSRAGKLPLCDHISAVRSQLGTALLNAQFYFVRVAGMRVEPPCGVVPAERTPSIVQLALSPEALRVPSLAVPSGRSAAEVVFSVQGTLPPGVAFPLIFEPDPGAPGVRVTCENGAPAAVAQPGVYWLRFQPVGKRELYETPFGGRLRLDLGRYREGAVERVMIWALRSSVQVAFAGVPSIELADSQVEPRDGLRVLTEQEVTFRAPLLDGADYSWQIEAPGLGRTNSAGHRLAIRFPAGGEARATLTVRQPGYTEARFNRRVGIVDPALEISLNPASPCEGETIEADLRHNPALNLSRITWEGGCLEQDGAKALYRFEKEGTYTVSVAVESELGPTAANLVLTVEPGIPEPLIRAPRDTLFLGSDPQMFEAEAGRGVASIRFLLEHGGQTLDLGAAPVTEDNGRWVARTNWVLPSAVSPGTGRVIAESIARNQGLAARVGAKQSTNIVELTGLDLLMKPRSPQERIMHWSEPLVFEAELLGPGASRVEALQWDVLSGAAGSGQIVAGLGRLEGEFTEEADRRLSTFTLLLDPSNTPLKEAVTAGHLTVRATPQGDARVVEDTRLDWEGMQVEWPPTRFVVYAPRRCQVDQPQALLTSEILSGRPLQRVRWTVSGPAGLRSFETTADTADFVFTNTGPHEVRAEVTWEDGVGTAEPAAVFVEYVPVSADVQWDGETDPELRGRGVTDRNVELEFGDFVGSRASAVVEVRQPDGQGGWVDLSGWPKTSKPGTEEGVLLVPWPPAVSEGESEYVAEIWLEGLDETGTPCRVKAGAFRLINSPPPRYWMLGMVLVLGGALFYLVQRWCWGNALATARVYVGVSAGDVRDHRSGSLRIGGRWSRWHKVAPISFGELAKRIDDLPRWLATEPSRTLRASEPGGRTRLHLPEPGSLFDFEFDQGMGTLTWLGERSEAEARQLWLRLRRSADRFRWETLVPWLVLATEVILFLWVYQQWA